MDGKSYEFQHGEETKVLEFPWVHMENHPGNMVFMEKNMYGKSIMPRK